MTDYEQKQIYSRLDRIASLLEQLITSRVVNDDGSKVNKATSDSDRYKVYKANGGTLKWNEWHRRDKNGEPITE